MGDRFYQQQLEKFGTCVGFKGTKRRRKMAWTDESKAQAVEMYSECDPTPETSKEIVKDIADELGVPIVDPNEVLKRKQEELDNVAPIQGTTPWQNEQLKKNQTKSSKLRKC